MARISKREAARLLHVNGATIEALAVTKRITQIKYFIDAVDPETEETIRHAVYEYEIDEILSMLKEGLKCIKCGRKEKYCLWENRTCGSCFTHRCGNGFVPITEQIRRDRKARKFRKSISSHQAKAGHSPSALA